MEPIASTVFIFANISAPAFQVQLCILTSSCGRRAFLDLSIDELLNVITREVFLRFPVRGIYSFQDQVQEQRRVLLQQMIYFETSRNRHRAANVDEYKRKRQVTISDTPNCMYKGFVRTHPAMCPFPLSRRSYEAAIELSCNLTENLDLHLNSCRKRRHCGKTTSSHSSHLEADQKTPERKFGGY